MTRTAPPSPYLWVALPRSASLVYLEFSGGVGTRQNDWRAWKNINNGRTDFKYLYHPLWYIVNTAKAAQIARANAFTVIGTTVRVTTPITLSMQLPAYGYVNPQRYSLNSLTCTSASARTADPAPNENAKPSPPPPLRSSPPPPPLRSSPPPPPLRSSPPPPPLRSSPPPPPLRSSLPPPPLRSSPPPPPLRSSPPPPPLRSSPPPPPLRSTVSSRMASVDTAIDAVSTATAAYEKSSAAVTTTTTTTTTAPYMLDESSVNIAARAAQQQTSSYSDQQTAAKLDTRGASVSAFEGSISPVFMQRLKALMSAYCRAQSGGDDCEVDWDGNTDWWRDWFLRLQPAQIATGLDEPVWNRTASGLDNVTSMLVVCPYRPFNYRCQIDAHSYQSTIITRSRTSTQSFGVTNRVQILFGFKNDLGGFQAGISFSASSSFSWSDGTAVANTETATTVQSYSVQMNPATNPTQKCAHLLTRMTVANVRGIQSAWLTINGYVGFHHDDASPNPLCLPARSIDRSIDRSAAAAAASSYSIKSSRVWKKWADSNPHYYRAQPFSSVIENAKSFGLKEAAEWTMVNGMARIQVPIDVVVMTGVSGSTGAVYYDAGSPQCNLPEPA
ncbi:hypothetical protein VOLCADRAFT_106366 [Volvox carteri f. nagariensis]|uniref:Pherophorin domain-containing protein n=1 Tax=Volvox carteri f. nagariensis TaxID=3068 RepID=D8U6X4_VOLCA|nr:uncharacterized protein VOLCADRAFT_106366 [Volvox carteri f. nagariensis]EFJ44589.1 hypothetical protein VOLCADRAFT_106366 [Volvox carteri f. nagariensis]|eukprot:XP_002954439.1 hypothetical protein VOLCADRAFT_106366 [Volvox carteri f. nagariensis]